MEFFRVCVAPGQLRKLHILQVLCCLSAYFTVYLFQNLAQLRAAVCEIWDKVGRPLQTTDELGWLSGCFGRMLLSEQLALFGFNLSLRSRQTAKNLFNVLRSLSSEKAWNIASYNQNLTFSRILEKFGSTFSESLEWNFVRHAGSGMTKKSLLESKPPLCLLMLHLLAFSSKCYRNLL